MQAAPSEVNWNDMLSNAEHVATVLGIAAAGVWGYFNFIKSRTYHPRMEMTVSGDIRHVGEHHYLVPRITLNNIGNSKIALLQKGSGYRIWVATTQGQHLHEVEWSKGTQVYSMFKDHHWIEPGESIFDETRLIPLPGDCIAAKIEARLLAQVKRFPRKKNTEWNGAAVVGPGTTSEGGSMNNAVISAQQKHENPKRTNEWERDKRNDKDDRDRMQREEDPQKTKDWERDKGDTTTNK
jgi:hypothetical protein